jgi:uncharacterized membrane protein YhaH (DUF805 family)
MHYFINAFRYNYANFEGRARREEFWMFNLFHILFFMVPYFVGIGLAVSNPESPSFMIIFAIVGLYVLASFVPGLAITVRRLHDVGKSGWYYFISFIPLVGAIWLFVLLVTDSEYGENIYGPNPKGIGNTSDDQEIESIGNGEI